MFQIVQINCAYDAQDSPVCFAPLPPLRSAFVYLLCCVHFTDYLVRVPCAVSVVWNAIIGSTIAVLWRFLPLPDDRPAEADLPRQRFS